MKKSLLLACFGVGAMLLGCTGEAVDENTQSAAQELGWCYSVPLDTVLGGLTEEERATVLGGEALVRGIYCGTQRPAEAVGDAVLPIRIDRANHELYLEGGLEDGGGVILVRIGGLEPGVWTEYKKVYNLSETPWTGWQVTMGNAELIKPETVQSDVDAWVDVSADFAEARRPEAFHASMNGARNAVFFGEFTGPIAAKSASIQPGDYIEKVWSYVVPEASDLEPLVDAPAAGAPAPDIFMAHGQRAQ